MALTFTAPERLSLTRRQMNIAVENASYASSNDAFLEQETKLLQVDGTNTNFHNYYNTMSEQYETEARQMDGKIPATYTASDLTNAAKTPNIPPFFPITPTPYVRLLPLINDGALTNYTVKGRFHPTGTDARYEQIILTNPSGTMGLTEAIYRLENGITGASSGNETTSTAVPGGPQTGVSISVTDSSNFTPGELVYINSGANSGIYKVTGTGVGPDFVTVDSVLPSTAGISSGGTMKNTVVAFTSGERQSLISATYQEILTSITTSIASLMTEWQGKLTAQNTAIGLQTEDRATYMGQNATAVVTNNGFLTTITTWQGLPNTGGTGKYTSGSISPVSAAVASRITGWPARITQIEVALGTNSASALLQTGDAFSATDPTNPYFKRYGWVNYRINRASGSLRRYYSAQQSKDMVNTLAADNTAIKGEYDAYFITKAVTFNDGTDILHIDNTTGLSVSDTITVVSETQPEITRTIVSFMGTTQVKLSAAVSKDYKIADKARIFKTL